VEVKVRERLRIRESKRTWDRVRPKERGIDRDKVKSR
jgi:hypothetical protein